jgi:hypothetical protein
MRLEQIVPGVFQDSGKGLVVKRHPRYLVKKDNRPLPVRYCRVQADERRVPVIGNGLLATDLGREFRGEEPQLVGICHAWFWA